MTHGIWKLPTVSRHAVSPAQRSARFFAIAALAGLAASAWAQSTTTPATAPPSAAPAVETEPELPAVVQVTGINSLVDYAAVGRLLSSVPGVHRVDVTEANGANVTYRVMVRGGSAALDRGISAAPQLEREVAANGQLVFHYRR